jgi:hypothetical protein
VLFDDMGLKWFLYSILIVSTTTYILAFYIKDILEIFSDIFTGVFKVLRILFFGLFDRLPNSLTSWLNILYLAFSKCKMLEKGKRWSKKIFGEKVGEVSGTDLGEDTGSAQEPSSKNELAAMEQGKAKSPIPP